MIPAAVNTLYPVYFRDGSLYVFDCRTGQCLQALYQLHDTDTQAVDFQESCIVSGSRDNTVKVPFVIKFMYKKKSSLVNWAVIFLPHVSPNKPSVVLFLI